MKIAFADKQNVPREVQELLEVCLSYEGIALLCVSTKTS